MFHVGDPLSGDRWKAKANGLKQMKIGSQSQGWGTQWIAWSGWMIMLIMLIMIMLMNDKGKINDNVDNDKIHYPLSNQRESNWLTFRNHVFPWYFNQILFGFFSGNYSFSVSDIFLWILFPCFSTFLLCFLQFGFSAFLLFPASLLLCLDLKPTLNKPWTNSQKTQPTVKRTEPTRNQS